MKDSKKAFIRRKKKIRANITNGIRLSVFRSNKNIYAQVIDDSKNITIAAASSIDKSLRKKFKLGGNSLSIAKNVGELVAKRAIAKGIKKVVFDRSGYLYFGKVKTLADAVRNVGIDF